MQKTVLLIATHDTKEAEAQFVKECIKANEFKTIVMDTGILGAPGSNVDISREDVADRSGKSLKDALASGDKRACTEIMCAGAAEIATELCDQGRIHGVIGIGGAQGTEIASAAMRAVPTGVPRMMASTVANGPHQFGFYVGTKDLTIMHTVSDLQGLNFLSKQILKNAANAICGMAAGFEGKLMPPEGIPVALSMLGTTTPGALRAKNTLESNGYEVVTFHQNGTGGIAMEDMISEGVFKGVLDLNLHEIGDRYVGGLHGAIREGRLTAGAKMGLPQVVAPGSSNYTVQGSAESMSDEMRGRKYFRYNPHLTLVRLSHAELKVVGKEIADKLNQSKGPVRVFVPLKGVSQPDQEGMPHWEPEGNQIFFDAIKDNLKSSIPYVELDAHINEPEFIDPVIEEFMKLMDGYK